MKSDNHYEGFEKEAAFTDMYCKVKIIAPSLYLERDFKKVVRLINPELLEGLYEARSCKRMLRYTGEEHDFFRYGEIYYSIDFTGATYSFEGYVKDNGKPKRIGCAYFDC